MSALGDLLETIHSAHRSLGSVQGTLREWRNERLVGRLESDHWPFGPADEHELVFDPVRGTVLRIAGMWRRREAFVHELVELEHDVTFDEETFEITPPGVISGLGLQEAARLAGFQLWALPQPVLDVTYRPEPLESVTLTYSDALVVLTSASVEQGWVSVGYPEEIECGGRRYWLTEREVVFAADDTWIRLSHDTASHAELIDITESLIRLP